MATQKRFIKLFTLLILLSGLFFIKKLPAQAQISNIDLSPLTKENNFVLSWSANSFVPIDYPGKALPSVGSEIKVVVSPIKKLSADPNKLYYRWLLDKEVVGWASGQGKSSFKFKVPSLSDNYHAVEIQILDGNNTLLFKKSIEIPVVSPEILIKQKNNYYAVKNSLSANSGQNISLIATPLFFSVQKINALSWQWTFAGQGLISEHEKDPNLLTLKIPEMELTEMIKKSLSLLVLNSDYLDQRAFLGFNIEIK